LKITDYKLKIGKLKIGRNNHITPISNLQSAKEFNPVPEPKGRKLKYA
jgi:hypothetical protein